VTRCGDFAVHAERFKGMNPVFGKYPALSELLVFLSPAPVPAIVKMAACSRIAK